MAEFVNPFSGMARDRERNDREPARACGMALAVVFEEMFGLMRTHGGIGLAVAQAGLSQRLCLANPVIPVAVFLFLAVWVPCCTSDIVLPLLFSKA